MGGVTFIIKPENRLVLNLSCVGSGRDKKVHKREVNKLVCNINGKCDYTK